MVTTQVFYYSHVFYVAVFACELCNKQFPTQLKFFEHLKVHYEPGSNKELDFHSRHPTDSQSGSSHTPTIQDSFSIKTEFQPQVGRSVLNC